MTRYPAAATRRRSLAILLVAIGMAVGNAHAVADTRADPQAGAGADIFTVSGFGTVGAVHSSNTTADYTSTYYQPSGAGYSHRYDFGDDTRVGVQLGAQFTNRLSAVVQVIAQHQYDNRFAPNVEWANVRYAFTPDFSVRLGRVELPTFFGSDVRHVGFANPWVHVPLEIYSSNPVTNSDGIDFSYRLHGNGLSSTFRLLYGSTAFHISPGGFRTEANGIVGLFDTLDYRDVTVHLGFERASVTVPYLPSLPVRLFTAGALYDPGQAFVQAEISRLTADTLMPGYISGYVTLGYRARAFTPYVTYAREFSMNRPVQSPNGNTGQTTWSVGTRWDVTNRVDVKIQFDHVSMPSGSYGFLVPKSATYQLGSGTNVLSACLDFVF